MRTTSLLFATRVGRAPKADPARARARGQERARAKRCSTSAVMVQRGRCCPGHPRGACARHTQCMPRAVVAPPTAPTPAPCPSGTSSRKQRQHASTHARARHNASRKAASRVRSQARSTACSGSGFCHRSTALDPRAKTLARSQGDREQHTDIHRRKPRPTRSCAACVGSRGFDKHAHAPLAASFSQAHE